MLLITYLLNKQGFSCSMASSKNKPANQYSEHIKKLINFPLNSNVTEHNLVIARIVYSTHQLQKRQTRTGINFD